jgi:hypothetical protein
MPNALPYPLHYPIMLCTTVWNYASHFTPESCTQFLPHYLIHSCDSLCMPSPSARPRRNTARKTQRVPDRDLVVCVS